LEEEKIRKKRKRERLFSLYIIYKAKHGSMLVQRQLIYMFYKKYMTLVKYSVKMANIYEDMIFTKCLEHDSKRLPVRMKIVFYANVLIEYDTQLSKG